MEINQLTERVIGAAIEVHRRTGPGLLESSYQKCMERELTLQGIPFSRQHPLPISYKGLELDCGYRLDFLIDQRLALEVKAVQALTPLFDAQLLTYLKLGGWKVGLLINLNVPLLVDGVRRKVLGL